MKWAAMTFSVIVAIALSPCARAQTALSDFARREASAAIQDGSTCSGVTREQVMEQQDRINKYLHGDVVPKMAKCWETLTGKGSVAISFDFRRDKDRWALGDAKLHDSSLPEGEGELAMHCLKEAMLDTSFAVTDIDAESVAKGVNWSFPVPWPKSEAEAVQLAIDTGGGGGGCGGTEGPAPACWDCVYAPGRPTTCKAFCTGYKTCSANSDGHGCNMTPISPTCVTGSVFGNAGGVVMY